MPLSSEIPNSSAFADITRPGQAAPRGRPPRRRKNAASGDSDGGVQTPVAPRSDLVIVAEDHGPTAEGMALLLKSVGLRTLCYSRPSDLLNAPFDDACCVVLDVRMPEMSGIELFKRLRDKGVTTPVIFMSGFGDLSMAVDALRAGALHFLEKPVDDQALIDAVLEAANVDSVRRVANVARRERKSRLQVLTARELEVARLYAAGKSSREIADYLEISLRTVQTFRTAILLKLNITTLTALVPLFED